MKHIRSLQLFSLLSLIIPLYLSANQPLLGTTHSQEWGSQCSQYMNPQELQLTANILYLLYANAVIDSKVQQFFTPISRLTQAIISDMTDHKKNPSENLATLRKLADRLALITGTRVIYTEMLNVCLSHYDKNQIAIINSALENLQLHAQDVLRTHAHETTEKTNAYLKKSEKILADSAQLFAAASGFHKGLSEGSLPFESTEENKPLMIIDALLQGTHMLIQNTDAITNTLNDTCDHAMKIICVGTELYKQHYNALYTIITAPSFDKHYAKTMFSMHGLLPEEYTSPLPHPDHVFEHMLQTAKLYTQTEIVQ
jgi:hypothetical protein